MLKKLEQGGAWRYGVRYPTEDVPGSGFEKDILLLQERKSTLDEKDKILEEQKMTLIKQLSSDDIR